MKVNLSVSLRGRGYSETICELSEANAHWARFIGGEPGMFEFMGKTEGGLLDCFVVHSSDILSMGILGLSEDG